MVFVPCLVIKLVVEAIDKSACSVGMLTYDFPFVTVASAAIAQSI